MSAPRWSTPTLLGVFILAAWLGFCAGHLPLRDRTTAAFSDQHPAATLSAPQTVMLENSPPVAPVENFAFLCRQLLAQPATPDRDAELLAALEKLAEQNPLAAIDLARSETNQRLRLQLLDAAFRGWGQTDADAAADWILAQPKDRLDQAAALASVLKSAVKTPDHAVQLTQRLNQQNPGLARENGDALIYAFAQNGNFQAAADFAANGEGPLRSEWLAAAYGSWANYQPANAAAGALAMTDTDTRADSLNAVISSWGQVNPQALADFAINRLPAGDQRTHALSDALIFLAGNNPTDAANWINQFDPSPDFDPGAAAIATQSEVMQQPDVALNWAQIITDPNLRSRTLSAIVETWFITDPSAAANFVQTSADLLPADRASLLTRINQP